MLVVSGAESKCVFKNRKRRLLTAAPLRSAADSVAITWTRLQSSGVAEGGGGCLQINNAARRMSSVASLLLLSLPYLHSNVYCSFFFLLFLFFLCFPDLLLHTSCFCTSCSFSFFFLVFPSIFVYVLVIFHFSSFPSSSSSSTPSLIFFFFLQLSFPHPLPLPHLFCLFPRLHNAHSTSPNLYFPYRG